MKNLYPSEKAIVTDFAIFISVEKGLERLHKGSLMRMKRIEMALLLFLIAG